MPENSNKKQAPDTQRINVHEDDEVRYWTKRFHVSEQKLKKAVSQVGPRVKDVKRALDN